MRNFFLIIGVFLSVGILADGHKSNEKSAKDRFANNPNHLMDFKECRELKDGIGGLLAVNDGIWKEIEMNPENEEKWLEVALFADLAANYSEIYDVFCKDMIAQRMKMRIMADKKNHKHHKKEE
jgi:hypothetical protein|tara:strand:- start:289 stop:660 length:372 start_codon:yes stop_codon:yes gene_type:complete